MSWSEWLALIGGLAVGFCVVYIILNASSKPRIQAQNRNRFEQNDWQEARQQQQRQQSPRQPAIAEQWFRILEVSQNATRAEIERAYKVKISQYHPDKVAQMGVEIRELAEAKSKEINAAYDYAMARFESRVM